MCIWHSFTVHQAYPQGSMEGHLPGSFPLYCWDYCPCHGISSIHWLFWCQSKFSCLGPGPAILAHSLLAASHMVCLRPLPLLFEFLYLEVLYKEYFLLCKALQGYPPHWTHTTWVGCVSMLPKFRWLTHKHNMVHEPRLLDPSSHTLLFGHGNPPT